MRTLTTSIFVILLSFLIPVEEVHAKKFGGGFSLGKSYTAPKKVTPSPTYNKQQDATPSTAPAQGGAAATRRPGLGGMMGGLLAGGLLGALFFGGAFEGIQLMDILIVGLIGFLLFKLLAGKRRQQPAYAGVGGEQDANTQWRTQERSQAAPTPPPVYDGGIGSTLADAELELPEWFNKKAFLEQACSHFTGLQKSWDEADWETIGSYTSPELFEELKAQRARFPERQHTEVVSVMADLINFIDEGGEVIVSLHFYGWMREDEESGTAEFSEIWHLSRDMSVESADWFIVGIEQPK